MYTFTDVYFVYEVLSDISKEAFIEYTNTSKFHFIKRAILKGIQNKLNRESYKQLLLAEKLLDFNYKSNTNH